MNICFKRAPPVASGLQKAVAYTPHSVVNAAAEKIGWLIHVLLCSPEPTMHVLVPNSLIHHDDICSRGTCSIYIKGGKNNAQMLLKHTAKDFFKDLSTLLDVSSSPLFNKYRGQLTDPSNISTQAKQDDFDFRSIQKLFRIHP